MRMIHLETPPLRMAIERLYSVFGGYRPSTLDQSCRCCVAESEIAALRAMPLRKLSADDLSRYASKAVTTFGGIQDFKYFLPRISELITAAPFPVNSEIAIGGKLYLADFPTWPESERGAVDQFLTTLWESALGQWPHHLGADELLHASAAAGILPQRLETWSELATAEPTARSHLADLICRWAPFTEAPAFWSEDALGDQETSAPGFAPDWRPVVAWLRRPAMAKLVEAAFRDWLATPEGDAWGHKLEQYRNWLRS